MGLPEGAGRVDAAQEPLVSPEGRDQASPAQRPGAELRTGLLRCGEHDAEGCLVGQPSASCHGARLSASEAVSVPPAGVGPQQRQAYQDGPTAQEGGNNGAGSGARQCRAVLGATAAR
ncbi:Uncharacterised protein [Actinomyces slackii]|uniref:Uncharacterized protein n=1 Tax=Actinomyces slackii TaxID=52774 RepID=A0A3S4U140_9ACTO|nr:Uncharacterised protein [Actinomyces slackii]